METLLLPFVSLSVSIIVFFCVYFYRKAIKQQCLMNSIYEKELKELRESISSSVIAERDSRERGGYGRSPVQVYNDSPGVVSPGTGVVGFSGVAGFSGTDVDDLREAFRRTYEGHGSFNQAIEESLKKEKEPEVKKKNSYKKFRKITLDK